MELRKLFTDERAVSPVVGVALLIAIAVILAAVIGAVVLGLGTTGAETPQAQLGYDYDAGNNYIDVKHQGGEPLAADEFVVVENGAKENLYDETSDLGSDDEFTAGQTITLGDGTGSHTYGGDTVSLVWQDPNGDSETVLEEFEP